MEDDNDDKDDTKRKSRNLSEKKRRDQFNLLVNDLSALISTSNRKMDKSTVLKSTIAFLKHHNDVTDRSKVHEIQQDWKPTFLTNDEFTHLMLESLDGFIIVFSSNGTIHYVSDSITSLLGYLPSDLLNMTIFDLAYEIDHENLYNIFLNPAHVIDPLKLDTSPENEISIFVHLKRGALDKVDTTAYELVKLVGYIRTDHVDNTITNTQPRSFATESGEKNLIFVGTARVQTPQLLREMSAIDPSKVEFTSKHSMEWKFLFLDHRAPPIIGYMPFEVLGTSGYDYYHFDDLENIVACHEELMQKGEGKSCCYRFLTKGQQWIWLQTDFYISYHQLSSKPDYVVCNHKVVSYAEVIRQNKVSTNHNSSANVNRNPSATITLRDLECAGTAAIAAGGNSGSVGTLGVGVMDKQIATATTTSSPGLDTSMVWHSRKSVSNYGNISSAGISPNVKRKRYMHPRGNESDSTSMSAESATSRHSLMTHLSTQARARHSLSHLQHQHQQQQSASLSAHQQHQQHQHQQQQIQSQSHKMLPMISQEALGSQLVASPPTQFSQPTYPIRNTQLVGHTFLEPQQYLTAIPVQPVIAPFPVAPVLSPMTSTPNMLPGTVVMTPTQTQIQDQLQRKHDELQKLIMQQQDELRRVSEQLLMARYTLLQPVVPVTYNNSPSTSRSFNFTTNSIDQQSQQEFVNYNFGMSSSDQLTTGHHHDPHLNHQQSSQSHQQSMLTRNVSVPDLEHFGHEEIDAFLSEEPLQATLAPPQPTINPQPQQHLQPPQPSAMSITQHSLNAQQDDSLLSYMQLQTEPSSNLHFQMGISDDGSESRSEDTGTQNRFNPYQTTNNQLPNDLEILPYQMSQEQSQILFNSPHTPGPTQ